MACCFQASTANHMQVTTCLHFLVKSNDTGSNMAVMEIFMPSGFTVNKDSLPALINKSNREVKKIEAERDDTKVVVYFETITKKEKCYTIEAFRTHRVANQKPAPVIVYDYYDQSRRARSFYDVVPATLCDICEEEHTCESCENATAEVAARLAPQRSRHNPCLSQPSPCTRAAAAQPAPPPPRPHPPHHRQRAHPPCAPLAPPYATPPPHHDFTTTSINHLIPCRTVLSKARFVCPR